MTKRMLTLTISVLLGIALFFLTVWVLLTIPTCTTYPDGTKQCQNFEGPWQRNIWTEPAR